MKHFLLLLAVFITIKAANEQPPSPPETSGEKLQRFEDIKKEIPLKKTKPIIEDVEVSKELEGRGQNKLKGPSFVLMGVSISGNSVFDQKEIIKIVKPFVGKKIDSSTLKNIAAQITYLYKKNGYLTSECIIPAQKVKNGKVKFQIIEDRLFGIVLKGSAAYNYDKNIFMKYLGDLQGKVSNIDKLNEKLKLLSTLPITKIKPSLQKIKPGLTNLVLEIFEKEEKYTLMIDNSGSQYSGKNRIIFNGNINNIRGKSDEFRFILTTVKEPKYFTSFSTSYITPYGKRGGRVAFGYVYMYYFLNPDEVGTDIVVYEGKSNIYSLSYIEPLFWFNNSSFSYNVGFEKKKVISQTIENATGDVLVDGVDETFAMFIGCNFYNKDSFFKNYPATNQINFTVKQAIEGFWDGMTREDIDRKEKDNTFPITGPTKYGDGLNPSFTKYYLSLSRNQKFFEKMSLNLSTSGEYSKDRVPDSYEYNGGDYGYNARVGLSRNFTKYVTLTAYKSYTQTYTYDTDLKVKDTPSSSTGVDVAFNLEEKFKHIFFNLSYADNVEKFKANNEKIRWKLGVFW